jgi:ATP-dependent Lon protease
MRPKVETYKKKSCKNSRNDPDSDESSVYSDSDSDSDYEYESISDSNPSSSDRSIKKKRRQNKKYMKDNSSKQRRRRRQKQDESESDEDTISSSDESTASDDTMASLHRTLYKLFPSKYTEDKVKSSNKNRRQKSVSPKNKSKSKSKSKRRSSKEEEDDDEEEEFYEDDDEEETVYEDIEDDEDDEDDDDEDDDAEYEVEEEDADEKKYKITFTIGGNNLLGPGLNRVASNLSCEDEYTIEDEKTFMKENYETVPEPPVSTLDVSKSSTKDKKKDKDKKKKDADDAASETVDIEDKYKEIIDLKKVLLEKLNAKPRNTILQKAIKQCDHSIKKLIKHARSKNAKTYEDLLSNPETQEYADEISFFKKKMSNKEQLRVMNDLKEINNYMFIDKPYRLSLLQSKIPPKLKATALQKLNVLNQMEPGVDNEYYKLKNWVDTFMRIPFGVNKNLTISMSDGLDKCSDFVVQAKKCLDTCVYGLNDAKMQIMQMIGQWISNPSSLGTAIAIHGPPGTGKTSLIKDGISKILGREFTFIALGGCGDSSFLEGHGYTYEGSTWGKIVQILIESKCMNPVIYFDELDKISDTARGQEIIGILTHLTDTSQNSQFHDKYFSEIDFDLSKCLFIFSYNDESLVNPILRDRMYKIKTKGYDAKEKTTIAKDHLLPKIREQVGFVEGEIIIPDDVLTHIISNQAKGEAGVRNLKRCLEVIHTKLNLYRLVKSGTGVFDKDMGLKVEFPYTVSKKDVDTLIKVEEGLSQSVLCSMYM